MFCDIGVVSDEYSFPDFLIIGFRSFLVWDVAKGQTPKDTNVLEVLALACPGFFGDHLSVVLAFGWESVSKIIRRFHCFSPKTVWKSAVN